MLGLLKNFLFFFAFLLFFFIDTFIGNDSFGARFPAYFSTISEKIALKFRLRQGYQIILINLASDCSSIRDHRGVSWCGHGVPVRLLLVSFFFLFGLVFFSFLFLLYCTDAETDPRSVFLWHNVATKSCSSFSRTNKSATGVEIFRRFRSRTHNEVSGLRPKNSSPGYKHTHI